MIELLVAAGLAMWAGATLLLSHCRWFARSPLDARLRPYSALGAGREPRAGLLSFESFREIIAPLSRTVGERLARVMGVTEDLALRLQRIHSPLDPTAFRVRQIGAAVAAVGVAVLLVIALEPLRGPLAGVPLLAGPLLAFLVMEQRVATASSRWQRRIYLELPVVAEQLAMLLSSGYSLGAAVHRVAVRGNGAVATDLRRVAARMRQGLSEVEALREWAAIAQVEAVDRLMPVLAMNREASDLGRLLADEARAIRKAVQRESIERMERKGQQVWIPVTVATLVPGMIFMLIPFLAAVELFAG
ncbi:hypothetical protein ER308_11020 [Egibacter rhizosphaerae]|uniref:Type II secretion system protein GspF domain-containing protein n=1 Tax=Egibacter rhizosphaerae TaxID=1670831 RepID=A0A411YFP6_9ACTN|nr:type II secretion system F family protein [Egibacter rhizosphaerae]QBI20038.1 hypothetical protein ER308_11020 [Egibacter rhizosphaerae]